MFGVHAPPHSDVRGLAGDAELRVRRDRGLRVARHLDLGHDGHEPIARVGDDLADVILRVEAAVTLTVELPRRRVVAAA